MTDLIAFLYIVGFCLTFAALIALMLDDIIAHWAFGWRFTLRQMGDIIAAAFLMASLWPVVVPWLSWRIFRA